MKFFVIASLVLSTLFSASSFAADPTPEESQIARDKLKADKKFAVSSNMDLTEAEAKAFWSVYENYQADLAKNNLRLIAVITDYHDNFKTMTDEKALKLATDRTAIDVDRENLAQSYLPKFSAVLPGKKVARYYQIEFRLRTVLDIELAKMIPLVNE